MMQESDMFGRTSEFAVKHEEHTGHEVQWIRADFEYVEMITEWRVLCMECNEAWWFESEDDAQEFQAEHSEYTDHEITTPIKKIEKESPEVADTVDTRSVMHLVRELEDQFDQAVPEQVIFAYFSGDLTAIEEVQHELNRLKRQGDLYEPTSGHLRTI